MHIIHISFCKTKCLNSDHGTTVFNFKIQEGLTVSINVSIDTTKLHPSVLPITKERQISVVLMIGNLTFPLLINTDREEIEAVRLYLSSINQTKQLLVHKLTAQISACCVLFLFHTCYHVRRQILPPLFSDTFRKAK